MATQARPAAPNEPGRVEAALAQMVGAGHLNEDPAQRAVAQDLDDVLDELALTARRRPRLIGRLTRRRNRRNKVRGLYIWGRVGRGKTMLMDLFHGEIDMVSKRRVHFNDFMADTHRRIAAARKAGDDEAVMSVADAIAAQARVLCFDEFAVTDIADAMILSRLFERLFERGVTLVATSNLPPQSLYEGGLNRALFLPFLALLADHVEVVRLDAETDYRLDRLEGRRVYFGLGDPGLDRLWRGLCEAPEASCQVRVGSRAISLARTCGGLARLTFAEACDAPLSAADQLALVERFHTLFLEGVPVMTPDIREAARRFINLVDVAYDQRVRLVVSAAAEPDALFDRRGGGAEAEAFAFARTASRLYEMRSASYLHAVETTPMG